MSQHRRELSWTSYPRHLHRHSTRKAGRVPRVFNTIDVVSCRVSDFLKISIILIRTEEPKRQSDQSSVMVTGVRSPGWVFRRMNTSACSHSRSSQLSPSFLCEEHRLDPGKAEERDDQTHACYEPVLKDFQTLRHCIEHTAIHGKKQPPCYTATQYHHRLPETHTEARVSETHPNLLPIPSCPNLSYFM